MIFIFYLVLPPHTALLGHQVQNYRFVLIKKIFLQTLVEIIIRYKKKSSSLGPPYKQNESVYILGVGYQNRLNRVRGVHF